MPIDRKSLKREAKAQLHLAWPGVAGVTLVYLLLAVALSQVLEFITSNPIGTFTAMAQATAALRVTSTSLAAGEVVHRLVVGHAKGLVCVLARTDRRLLVVADRPGRALVESLHPHQTMVGVQDADDGTVTVVVSDGRRVMRLRGCTRWPKPSCSSVRTGRGRRTSDWSAGQPVSQLSRSASSVGQPAQSATSATRRRALPPRIAEVASGTRPSASTWARHRAAVTSVLGASVPNSRRSARRAASAAGTWTSRLTTGVRSACTFG